MGLMDSSPLIKRIVLDLNSPSYSTGVVNDHQFDDHPMIAT